LKKDVWDKSFEKQCLGQIVGKTMSGTSRLKTSVWHKSSVWNKSLKKRLGWDTSFEKLRLGQIV